MLLLKDIRKGYRQPDGSQLPILSVKQYQLAAGEQAVLMGRSGSGKTTLLHVIAGISRPDEGVVRIDGCDIVRLSESGRDRFRADKLGYVYQTFNLMSGFSALENVLLAMSLAGRSPDTARAKRLLERVGLKHRLDHRPAMLSVGEQQRVAVARALAGSPSILLADEPTGNLDSKNGEAVMHLLADLHREGSTICMVTHDPRFAKHAQREVHLFDGKVVSEDELKKLTEEVEA
jgi:putative ABC transport system ATP-binding protein